MPVGRADALVSRRAMSGRGRGGRDPPLPCPRPV